MDIGIDLGTTFSVIAIKGRPAFVDGYPEGEYLEECDVTIIHTPEYEPTIPSVVFERPESGELVVGMEAKQAAESGQSPVMWSKRKIGTTEKLNLGDRKVTAMDAATEILKYLKSVAERALGQPVNRAVVTHPAYFDRSQVEETRKAAGGTEGAGFNMSLTEQMLMEPVAAALAYTKSDTKDPLKIMVYDLGGGTFDVTILERKGGVISCKAFDGNPLLGGYNFDRKLVDWIREKLEAKGRKIRYNENDPEDRGRLARLLTFAESLKLRLAEMGRRKKVPIDVQPNFLVDEGGKNIQVRERISQEDFVALIKPELEDTIECCFRCLEKADMSVEELDYVLLVGGSTHGPWIDELIKEKLGVEPQRFRPDLCVAAGAAIRSESLPPAPVAGKNLKVILNITAKSILATTDVGGRIEVSDAAAVNELTALLKTPQGRTLGPLPIAEDGTFLFQEVELLEDKATNFALQLIDASGTPHLEHTFSITYEPESTDIGTFQTVLPKPLYLKTARGMRALAEEGQKLPSDEITIGLKRLHSEPSLEIPVYQGDEKMGAITISDIPAEAGEGAKVVLKVEVTAKNVIKGKAQVFATRSAAVAAECPVRVSFPPVPIPELSELEKQFQDLEDDRAQKIVMTDDPAARTLLINKGNRLAGEIKSKMDELVPDRQEIMSLLRELDRVVNPPKEDMNPPRAKFDSLLIECRELLAAKQNDPQMQTYVRFLEKIEREGRDAFARKDRHKWAAVCDSLVALYEKLRPKGDDIGPTPPPPPLPPTPILKDHALMQISQARASLETVRQPLIAGDPAGYESKFKNRCEKVEQRLDFMEKKVQEIDDETESRQAVGQIQLALRQLPQVTQKIEYLKDDTQ